MSRLLTTMLLYRSGFYVGKYISLEAKIAGNKDFEDRFSIVEEKMPAIDIVRKATLNKIGKLRSRISESYVRHSV